MGIKGLFSYINYNSTNIEIDMNSEKEYFCINLVIF